MTKTFLIKAKTSVLFSSANQTVTASSSATSTGSYSQSDPPSVNVVNEIIEEVIQNSESNAINYLNNLVAQETGSAEIFNLSNYTVTTNINDYKIQTISSNGDINIKSSINENLSESTNLSSSDLTGASYSITTSTTSGPTPWTGGNINGYFLWGGNFVNYSPITQYYAAYDSSGQTYTDTSSNNIVTGNGVFKYNSNPPTDASGSTDVSGNLNCITIFSGYSNVTSALSTSLGMTNYTTNQNLYSIATEYFSNNNVTNYLLSLTLGGGYALTGSWDTGTSGSIYAMYEAVTPVGVSFSYTETSGNAMSGIGSGALTYGTNSSTYSAYNCLCFDIETYTSGSVGSSGQDFLNLFQYIKYNSNSLFYNTGVIIIITIAHSCSGYNGDGYSVFSTILSDVTGSTTGSPSYDYFSPQLYTENVGINNEYCANYLLSWGSVDTSGTFAYFLNQNTNYSNYQNAMILPAINNLTLLNSGGSYTYTDTSGIQQTQGNNGKPSNLYWYQSAQSASSASYAYAAGPSPNEEINYPTDTGAESFFTTIFSNSSALGGGLQWLNGELDPGLPITFPYPVNDTPSTGYCYWSNNFESNGSVYYYDVVTPAQTSLTNPINGVSCLSSQTSQYTYSSTIPSYSSSNANYIYLYSGYSDASGAVNATSNIYNDAYYYIHDTSGTGPPSGGVLSLAMGGNVGTSGESSQWNTGTSGAIYSIYKATTLSGVEFSYTETNTNDTLTGYGSAAFEQYGYVAYDGLLFDIETCNVNSYTSGNGSSGQDFLNLFQYIKYNSNSVFVSGGPYQCVITVAFQHSAPNYNQNGGIVISTILQDQIGTSSGKYSYNFIAPKLFTNNNLGTMNEYCPGSQLSWNDFVTNISLNGQFPNFNLNIVTPFILQSNLINGYGSNTTQNPNLYWYQSTSANDSTIYASVSGCQQNVSNYTLDNGATSFFNTIVNNVTNATTTTIGGSITWTNGTL